MTNCGPGPRTVGRIEEAVPWEEIAAYGMVSEVWAEERAEARQRGEEMQWSDAVKRRGEAMR